MKRYIVFAILVCLLPVLLSGCNTYTNDTELDGIDEYLDTEVMAGSQFDYVTYYNDMIVAIYDRLEIAHDILYLNEELDDAAWRDLVDYMSADIDIFAVNIDDADVPSAYKDAHDNLISCSETLQGVVIQLQQTSATDKQARSELIKRIKAGMDLCVPL